MEIVGYLYNTGYTYRIPSRIKYLLRTQWENIKGDLDCEVIATLVIQSDFRA